MDFAMKRRVDVLRKRLEKKVGPVNISDNMPDRVAERFLAEMRFCPDCAAAAAQRWSETSAPPNQSPVARLDAGDDAPN